MTNHITCKEPTYRLDLHEQQTGGSQPSQGPSYPSLSDMVTDVLEKQWGDELKGLSKKEIEKLRLQTAHSLRNRPDQKSSLKILLPLAEEQGLVESAKKRLENIPNLPKVDLTPVAQLIFSDCKEENFDFILRNKLITLFGSKSPELLNAVFHEVCKIRGELHELTSGTMKLYRPPQETDSKSYIDHRGETVTLSPRPSSSFERNAENVQNGRCNLDSKGHVIYSAGRIETERKARQVLYRLIHQTFLSGQLTTDALVKQTDESYLYPVAVENLISTSSIAKKEKALLLSENEVLKSLSGSNMLITLPSGTKINVKLKLLHFSTQTNYNAFLGQAHRLSCTGSDVAEQITQEGTKGLKEYFELRKDSLDQGTQEAVAYCLTQLGTCSNLRDRLMYRSFICELLNIPYHVHCKSSKDRTAVIAAIKKAIHTWIKLEAWKGPVVLTDPLQLFNNPAFREYSEAAFFENLPMTDQGVGFTGELDGKFYTENRGFNFQKFIFEHPAPVEALSDRYVYTAPLIERILYAGLMLAASIVLAAAYLPCIPFVVIAMSFINQKECLSAALYIFLCIIVLPTRSAFREKWLKRDSSELNERRFFLNRNKVQLAPSLKIICDQVNNLSSQQYHSLLQSIQKGTITPSEEETQILKAIAENWTTLQQVDQIPSRLKNLVEAGKSSPMQLFYLLNTFNQTFVMNALEKLPPLWPENSVDAIVRTPPTNGITEQFQKDNARTHYIIQTPYERCDFPISASNRSNELTKRLQQLSALKNESQIPFAVQEFLSQQMTLSYTLAPISPATPFKFSNRTLVIEEGDPSSFWLTIHEKAETTWPAAISFQYAYRFKISKSANNEWSARLVYLSPFSAKLSGDFNPLLKPSDSQDALSNITNATLDSFNDMIERDLEAVALWSNPGLVTFEQVQKQLERHLKIMHKHFPQQWEETQDKYQKEIEKHQNSAQSGEGKKLLETLAATKI